ncbi:MAG: response regulator, partial [Chloroflexota bacterium]|nr:response regulator [Chloroflexota bacterium]
GRASILIVDSNVGFAAMLQESLEQEGDYRAVVAHSGSEALNIASSETFELAIVDLGLDSADDLDGATVARRLRAGQRDLRLMLIPLEGDVLSEDVADLDVQSVLPKPFFLPDLPALIEDALTQPIDEAGPPDASGQGGRPDEAPEPATAPRAVSTEDSPELVRELEDLAREINAEVVLLTREGEILASVGRLSTDVLDQLAQLITQGHGSSHRLAEAMGHQRRGFEQTLKGGPVLLYSRAVAGDVILSAALSTDVALGIVRHRARGAADRLRTLIGAHP